MTVGKAARDDTTSEFFDGTARGEFLIRHCTACGQYSAPQADQCHACGSTQLSWVPASGDATIISWTITHGRSVPDRPDSVTVLAVAQLAEGPWWWSQIEGVQNPADLSPGIPLRITFERPDGSEAIPVFQLAAKEM